MGAGLGILFFGIMAGILIGVILSLVMLIARSSRTNIRRLHRDPTSGTYHDVSRHEGLEPIPGIVIARVDGPLFFADADRFRERLHELAREEERRRAIVVDAEAVHLTDTDGADILIQVEEELQSQGTALALRACPPTGSRPLGTCRSDRGGRRRQRLRHRARRRFERSPTATPNADRSLRKEQTMTNVDENVRDLDPGFRDGFARRPTTHVLDERAPTGRGLPGRGRCRTSRRPSGLPGARPRAASCRARRTPTGSRGRGAETRSISSRSRRRRVCRSSARSGTGACSCRRSRSSAARAYLMAADLADGPRTGLHAQLCGDAHLSNFGIFAAPDRRLVFSINDFDETLPGPFEWDVKRLAASFAVAGRDRGFNGRDPPLGRDGGGA